MKLYVGAEMKNIGRGIWNFPGKSKIRFNVVSLAALHERGKNQLDEAFGRGVGAHARIEVARGFIESHHDGDGFVSRRAAAGDGEECQDDQEKDDAAANRPMRSA